MVYKDIEDRPLKINKKRKNNDILRKNGRRITMKNNNICIVKLPNGDNYAIISPYRITYGLNASKKDLQHLILEEYELLDKKELKNESSDEIKTSIGIIPTFDCNLRCIYCYARGGETKETISIEVMTTAIKNATPDNNKDLLKIYLVGGGEPLLYFDLVSKVIDYAKTIYKNIEINVVTNGTFNEEVLNWLVEQRANVRISYDGMMHEKQRPFANGKSSRNIVKENIRKLVQYGISVTVQCIITREGIKTFYSTINEVVSLGVKIIKFEPALATDVSRANTKIEPNPKKYAEALLNVIKYVATKKFDIGIDTGFFAEPSNDFYCGMPAGNRVVTPHGLITSCVEVSRPDDPYADILFYGSIKNEQIYLDDEKMNFLKTIHFKNQIGGCNNCNLRLICHGGCPMSNIWKGGLPIKKSNFTCIVEHTFLPNLLLMIAQDPNIAKIVTENTNIDKF
ncbi:MAG: radical SAM protein [Patescibacteria group bacterium]